MSDPLPLRSAIRETLTRIDQRPREPTLPEQLSEEFGLGGEPQLRRNLYFRLERLVKERGKPAQQIIDEARAMARAPEIRNRGNYFARTVVLRLREGGIT